MKTFDQLYAELTDKAATRPAGSGTVAALDAGVHAIGKKIVEEAAEVWMAAEHESDEALAAEIKRRKIAYAYVAARGTSDNAALYGKYVLEIQHGLPVALAAPSVFTLYEAVPRLGANALVLGISQSGAAPDVLEVVKRARETGALTAAITNDPDSALAQAAEFPLSIGAGEEFSVAARNPARPAATTWSRISDSRGETTSAGPARSLRRMAVAAQ